MPLKATEKPEPISITDYHRLETSYDEGLFLTSPHPSGEDLDDLHVSTRLGI
jgi:hypothetical protein